MFARGVVIMASAISASQGSFLVIFVKSVSFLRAFYTGSERTSNTENPEALSRSGKPGTPGPPASEPLAGTYQYESDKPLPEEVRRVM